MPEQCAKNSCALQIKNVFTVLSKLQEKCTITRGLTQSHLALTIKPFLYVCKRHTRLNSCVSTARNGIKETAISFKNEFFVKSRALVYFIW